MAQSPDKIAVYLEIGKERTFAGAVDWQGWCRSGRDAESALRSLFDYAPRYARAIRPAELEFQSPTDLSVLSVVERLTGDSTTDCGAPGVPPSADACPVDETDLARFYALLNAFWKEFDRSVRAAMGKELTKGPRGGRWLTHGTFELEMKAGSRVLTNEGAENWRQSSTTCWGRTPLILGVSDGKFR